MALSDEQLLDFDASTMPEYEPQGARRGLREQGDVFRSQLVAARWIDYFREGVTGDSHLVSMRGEEWMAGFEYAMREIAAHLRQGDFLPGGELYEQEQRRAP